ncbi:glycosyltransferase family 9 protein [Streptomyces sp. MA5143a]|uniref:glycosyltransferase family 9 protein n=1 Tax=Streptomyces sp. MA5143a TaxID=2083010 RepID=UPI0035C156CD
MGHGVGGGDRVGDTARAEIGSRGGGREGAAIRAEAGNGDRGGLEAEIGDTAGTGLGNEAGDTAGTGPGNEAGNTAGTGPGNEAGNTAGTGPGNEAGNTAGTGPGNEAGNTAGTGLANEAGNTAGTGLANEVGIEVGAVRKPLLSVVGPGRPVVLVLRALGLGDLLTAVPALKALRRRLPGHEIVLAAPERLGPVAAATGLVDRLLPTCATGREVPKDLSWSGPPPDLAVDLHGNGPPSHLLLQRLGPRRLLAYAHPGTPNMPGPVWREDEHERQRWCRLLDWYGVEADPDDLGILPPTAASPAPGAIVVHPGADAGARRWPGERFAAVAGELRRRGHEVVVTAGAGTAEGARARYVAAAAGLPPSAVLVDADGDLPFDRLAALVAGSRCVIVGDTGPAHLATALGTPSVVLFGPVAPRLWGPPTTPRHRALWHPRGTPSPRPGDAHGDLPDERLLRITTEEVVTATLDVLNAERGAAEPDGRARERGCEAKERKGGARKPRDGAGVSEGRADEKGDRRAGPGHRVTEPGSRAVGQGGRDMTREVLR